MLVAIALWLGPLIKRFGRSYAADVFRANPRTGKSFIVLTDVAYYLIFFSYILFTVRFEPPRRLGRHGERRPAAARDGAGRRHPADHRRAPRRQPAGAAGDGSAADAQPPARRVDTGWTGGTDERAPRRGHGDGSPSSVSHPLPARTTGSRSSMRAGPPDALIEQTVDRLQDGDVLDVLVTDGEPGVRGAVRQCALAATGLASCRNHFPILFDDEGRAHFQYQLDDDGACGADATCVVAAGTPDESGVAFTVFGADAPPAPTVTRSPPGTVRPGEEVRVDVSGLLPSARSPGGVLRRHVRAGRAHRGRGAWHGVARDHRR